MIVGRKACQMGHCDPLAGLADAIHHTVHHTLGAKRLAERLGVRPGYLSDAANPDLETVQFQARLILPLVEQTNDNTILDYFEQERGRVAVTLPRVHAGHDELLTLQLRAVKEFGEQADAIGTSLADGHIDRSEAARISRELDDVSRAIAALKAYVLAAAETRLCHQKESA